MKSQCCENGTIMAPLIIVVDDDKAMRAMFALIAHDEGWMFSGYSYTHITLTTIQELQPELIVLDFAGREVGEAWGFLQLLKMEESTAAIPIMVVGTTEILPSEMAAYLASRSIHVIAKPLNVAHFVVVARELLNRQSIMQLVSTNRLPILIVEDSDDLSSSFMLILEMEGYLATAVPNGQLALDAVNNRQHSLIFLDINMPVMNGLEFMAAYAQLPPPHTPVVICSAQDENDLPTYSMPYFVIGRLRKPFKVNELVNFVQKYAVPV